MVQDVSVETQGAATGLPSVLLGDDGGREKNIPELASLAGRPITRGSLASSWQEKTAAFTNKWFFPSYVRETVRLTRTKRRKTRESTLTMCR